MIVPCLIVKIVHLVGCMKSFLESRNHVKTIHLFRNNVMSSHFYHLILPSFIHHIFRQRKNDISSQKPVAYLTTQLSRTDIKLIIETTLALLRVN